MLDIVLTIAGWIVIILFTIWACLKIRKIYGM